MVHIKGFSSFWISSLQSILLLLRAIVMFSWHYCHCKLRPNFFIIVIALLHFSTHNRLHIVVATFCDTTNYCLLVVMLISIVAIHTTLPCSSLLTLLIANFAQQHLPSLLQSNNSCYSSTTIHILLSFTTTCVGLTVIPLFIVASSLIFVYPTINHLCQDCN